MRTLSFSLILVVIISTLGLGWLFDNIYQQFSSPELNPNTANVAKQLGNDLARAANESSDGNAFLSHWPNSKQYSVVLQDVKDSPLPRALIKQMNNAEPVVLETIDNMAYHYLLPAKEQILILRTPMLNPKTATL